MSDHMRTGSTLHCGTLQYATGNVGWNCGNVGGLVAGFALGDVALIGRSMHDVVAEPYRKGFIPGYDVLKEGVLAEGALAMNIAGSGPSIFALAADEAVAQRVAQRMRAHFARPGIGCKIYAGRVSNCGARIVE